MAAPIGNQNATKEHRRWAEALNRAIAQDDGVRLRKAAESLLDQASEGQPWAVREIGDRLDGKAAQAVLIGNQDGNPFLVEQITRTVVDPKEPA